MAPAVSAISVVWRLKRMMSRSMRQKRGESRLRRCANTVSRLLPAHSSARAPADDDIGIFTANDISLALV